MSPHPNTCNYSNLHHPPSRASQKHPHLFTSSLLKVGCQKRERASLLFQGGRKQPPKPPLLCIREGSCANTLIVLCWEMTKETVSKLRKFEGWKKNKKNLRRIFFRTGKAGSIIEKKAKTTSEVSVREGRKKKKKKPDTALLTNIFLFSYYLSRLCMHQLVAELWRPRERGVKRAGLERNPSTVTGMLSPHERERLLQSPLQKRKRQHK